MEKPVLICQQCGCEAPELFTLGAEGKVPLCTRDVPLYIASMGGQRSSTFLPISSFDIVDTVADLPLYDEKIGDIEVGKRKVERLLEMEEEQFQQTNVALLKMKEDSISLLELSFSKLQQKFSKFHLLIVEELAKSKKEITSLRRKTLSKMAKEILRCSSDSPLNFYMELVTDITKKIDRLVDEALLLEYSSGEDFMMEVLRPDSLEQTPETAVEADYPKTSSSTLRVIPVVEPPPRKCMKCTTDCKRQFHTCKDDALCLDCYERLIATECYSKKRAECPQCGRVPSELYDFREKKKCTMCKFRLKITEIAHWCCGQDFIICDACYPKIFKEGKCTNCEETILPPRSP